MGKTKVNNAENETFISFDTFKSFGTYEVNNLKDNDISCFNSNVRIKKYRVTIELIEEPKEVYAERLQKLWDECDNHHHWNALHTAAEKIGYTLIGSTEDLNDMMNRLKGLYDNYNELNPMIAYKCFKNGSLSYFRNELGVL